MAQNFVVSGYARPGGEGKTLPLQRRILASIRDPQSTMSLAVGLFAACTALPSGGLAPTLRDIGPSTIGSYIRDAGQGCRAVRFVPAPDTHLIRVSYETVERLLEILGASGLEHPLELRPWHICQRTSQTEVQTYDEIYNYLEPGEHVGKSIPHGWRTWMGLATADTFLSFLSITQRELLRRAAQNFFPGHRLWAQFAFQGSEGSPRK